MASLSPECVERLRALDHALGMIAINLHADPGATHKLNLDDAARVAMTAPLTAPAREPDEDCKDIFKAIDPLLGLISKCIIDDKPVNIIRRHLESARAYIRIWEITL